MMSGALLRAESPAPMTYFDPATLDARAFLPAPPLPNADSVEKEIEVIMQLQADRTPQQVARITSANHYNIFAFNNVTGGWFGKDSVESMPHATALLGRVMVTAKPVVAAAKEDWDRKRPFQINSRVYPAIEKPVDNSYPSSHAARAFVDAMVLAQIAPDQAPALLARAQQIGMDRVAAGVEFPSDVVAGKKLAQAIYDRLMGEKQFRDDVKAARAEVDHARGKTR